jgi:hypothetical protein
MAKKYKSKVSFNKKKKPLMKYKNGGDGVIKEDSMSVYNTTEALFPASDREGFSKVHKKGSAQYKKMMEKGYLNPNSLGIEPEYFLEGMTVENKVPTKGDSYIVAGYPEPSESSPKYKKTLESVHSDTYKSRGGFYLDTDKGIADNIQYGNPLGYTDLNKPGYDFIGTTKSDGEPVYKISQLPKHSKQSLSTKQASEAVNTPDMSKAPNIESPKFRPSKETGFNVQGGSKGYTPKNKETIRDTYGEFKNGGKAIKYRNGGKEALGSISMKGSPMFDNVLSPGADMSSVGSVDAPEFEFGAEDSKVDPIATGIMAAGKTIGMASEFVKTPSLGKFTDSDYGNMQGQEYANKANNALKNSETASKVMSSTAAGLAALPVPGARIAAGVLAIGSGISKFAGKARANKQGNSAQELGDRYEKKEENENTSNEYLTSIGEQTFNNGGDFNAQIAKSDSTKGYNAAAGEFGSQTLGNMQNHVNWLLRNKGGEAASTQNAMEQLKNYGKGADAFKGIQQQNGNIIEGANPLPGQSVPTLYQHGGQGGARDERSELTKFFGPSHDNGGIDIGGGKEVQGQETARKNRDGEEFIFSGGKDGIGYDKKGEPTFDHKKTMMTFAERTEKIERQFNDRTDAISKRTREKLFDKVEADNRKVGPIADALAGNPGAEGKFLNGTPGGQYTISNPDEFEEMQYKEMFGRSIPHPDGKSYWGALPGEPDAQAKEYNTRNYPKEAKQNPKYMSKKPGFNAPSVNYVPKTNFGTAEKSTSPLFNNNTVEQQNNPAPQLTNQEEKMKLTPGDIAGIGSSIPSIGYNLAQGLKKSETEKLQLNPEAAKIKQLMADRSINFQSLENELTKERTKGAQDIGNNTRSVGSRNANLQALYANSADKKAGIRLKEQDANNRYRGEEAGVLNSLGSQESAEKIRQQIAQSQNDATKQNFMGQAAAEGGHALNTISKASNAKSTNAMTIKSVNALSMRYGISTADINKAAKNFDTQGELVQWLDFKKQQK